MFYAQKNRKQVSKETSHFQQNACRRNYYNKKRDSCTEK